MNKFAKFVGLKVRVKWRDPENDWPTFLVLAVDGNEVWLRGLDDGPIEHDGSSFVCFANEAKSVKADA